MKKLLIVLSLSLSMLPGVVFADCGDDDTPEPKNIVPTAI